MTKKRSSEKSENFEDRTKFYGNL